MVIHAFTVEEWISRLNSNVSELSRRWGVSRYTVGYYRNNNVLIAETEHGLKRISNVGTCKND